MKWNRQQPRRAAPCSTRNPRYRLALSLRRCWPPRASPTSACTGVHPNRLSEAAAPDGTSRRVGRRASPVGPTDRAPPRLRIGLACLCVAILRRAQAAHGLIDGRIRVDEDGAGMVHRTHRVRALLMRQLRNRKAGEASPPAGATLAPSIRVPEYRASRAGLEHALCAAGRTQPNRSAHTAGRPAQAWAGSVDARRRRAAACRTVRPATHSHARTHCTPPIHKPRALPPASLALSSQARAASTDLPRLAAAQWRDKQLRADLAAFVAHEVYQLRTPTVGGIPTCACLRA